MTQKELAERTGIDQADISKLENGNGNPTLGLQTLSPCASLHARPHDLGADSVLRPAAAGMCGSCFALTHDSYNFP